MLGPYFPVGRKCHLNVYLMSDLSAPLGGAVTWVGRIPTGMGRCEDRRSGSQCFNYDGSLLVPRNDLLPEVLTHPQPLPYIACANVKNRISAQRGGRAGRYWWSPIISGPSSPASCLFCEVTQKFTPKCENETISVLLCKPSQQLCPDMLSPWAEEAAKNIN